MTVYPLEAEVEVLRAERDDLRAKLAAAEELAKRIHDLRSIDPKYISPALAECEQQRDAALARVKELEAANGRGYAEWKEPWNKRVNELEARVAALEGALRDVLEHGDVNYFHPSVEIARLMLEDSPA